MKQGLFKNTAIWVVLPLTFVATPVFQTGKIIKVENKTRSRVLYYLVNTPITAEDPYYEIEVQLKETIYLGEYQPPHSEDVVPSEWAPGIAVQVRIDKRHMIIKSPGGIEFTTLITKRTAAVKDSPKETKERHQ